jgi:uncharacterized integral membrane protein (TIGR00698 family)
VTIQQTVTLDLPAETAASTPPKRLISEDWLAVCIGAVLIATVIAGVRPALPRFSWDNAAGLSNLFAADNLARSLQLGILILIPAAGGALMLGARLLPFIAGFTVLYALAWLAQALAGFAGSTAIGLEYVIYALVIGLVLGHVTPLRRWFTEAVQAEYYIKIGLVILGASVLFGQIVEAGLLGVSQAIVVVLSVWFVCFRLCKYCKVDDELATMLSAAVSICGVSAAIAVCGAIQGDRKKLSYVSSLVLIVAVPMMIVMPWISRAMGMPEVVAGAWLGGTLDTSAAVVAAGELVSEQARNAAVVVKLSQNVLIGVAAFALTVWWALRNADRGDRPQAKASIIWERFPKFVLGFLLVSFFFSFALPDQVIADTRAPITAMRTAWFALAFVAIGLETSVGELVATGEGRPALAFLGGQAFNIVITLAMAYLLFGGILFSAPAFN